ncbi:S8 family peptidase [Promicromonospora sukumoe]|uniref:S8 family peptidase n=1 Tax=Promicromonospora sukumoe TaxID=88382 RepID=UPI00039BDFD8|nr:S8 family serine peptidase [Promicromonospora sukumoe]
MRARTGAAAAVIAVAVALGGGVPAWSSGAAGAGGGQAGAEAGATDRTAAAGASSATVTLITGDQVDVGRYPDGRRSVTVRPAAGREGIAFQKLVEGDSVRVIPGDVARLVPDRLDPALFDVTGLVAAGYDDAHRDTVPVIVQDAVVADAAATAGELGAAAGPDAAARARHDEVDWAALGVEPERSLPSVGAVSADLDRAAAADLLATLDQAPAARSAGPAVPEVKVWLDGRVEALDVGSMPQIGAPAAWDAGFTGDGVTVGVLDSGIDTTHPDLDDVLVGARDFTGSGDTADRYGHGTHVASIALGSGEASDGENRGVAHGADLLVGKVLDDFGGGESSSIIDGMEWIAEAGADVVNMSLGESERYTDGTDPFSMAVDTLSAEYGTLFVVAVGNEGLYGAVVPPGAANSALTVGAVDDDDQVAYFSSRGPRVRDYAIKPDITAPGVEIVAARAAGTNEWESDGPYTAWSGTSMAAPHVAGAAAVLKQARPELTGPQLKAVLMGSARHTSGGAFEEGAGRVFVPAALDLSVTSSPASLSFGAFEYPQEGTSTHTLTYENPGDAAVTLDLAVEASDQDGEPLPTDAVTLDATSLTVPAGGTAAVEVGVDRTVGAVERRYSGAVTATDAEGREVRTPLGYYKEPDLADLDVRTLGRDGEPHTGSSSVRIVNVDDPTLFDQHGEIGPEGLDLRVPPGRYSITGFLWTTDEEYVVSEVSAVLRPEVTVADDTTVVLDAREARELSVSTHRPSAVRWIALDDTRTTAAGDDPYGFGTVVGAGAKAYATPTDAPVTVGTYDLQTHFVLEQPVAAGRAPSYTYDLLYAQDVVDTFRFRATARNTAAVTTTYASLGADHAAESARVGTAPGHLWGSAVGSPVAVPGRRTEYLSANGVAWGHQVYTGSADDPQQGWFDAEARTYAPREKARTTVGGAVLSARTGTGAFTVADDTLGVRLVPWSDAEGHPFAGFNGQGTRLRVWQDGEAVLDQTRPSAEVALPVGGAAHRVILDARNETSWWERSTRTRTEWRFRAAPDAAGGPAVLDVGYAVGGLDARNVAPRGSRVTLTVGSVAGGPEDRSARNRVTTAHLWWSADDGATWHAVPLTDKRAGTFTGPVRVPRGTEHVSLRVEARDASGGSIKQTVIRAYAVR